MYENDELTHYGVPGMKWGRRKAYKYENAARVSTAAAREWDLKAQKAKSKGRNFKAAQYEENAKLEREKAAVFTQKSKGTYSRRANKLANKAQIAKESAREWDEMSKVAKSRGKIARAEKYAQYAKSDRLAADYYKQKSKTIVEKRLARKQLIKDISTTTMNKGKETTNRIKNKLTSGK